MAVTSIFDKYNVTERYSDLKNKSTVCVEYTNYLKSIAKSGKPAFYTLVALIPCTLIYQKVGEYLKHKQQLEQSFTINNYYQTWIDTYSSEQRRKSVENILAITNRFYSSAISPSRHIELLDIFKKASEYEYEFWTNAYIANQQNN